MQASFLSSGNAAFITELYQRYLDDPASVDPSWCPVFEEFSDGPNALARAFEGPSWGRLRQRVIGCPDPDAPPPDEKASQAVGAEESRAHAVKATRVMMLIQAYQSHGHFAADLDPLGMTNPAPRPELDYRSYGFDESDLDREVLVNGAFGMERAPLRRLISSLKAAYCSTIGVEFVHLQDREQRTWLQKRIEEPGADATGSADERRGIFERLCEAEGFERFLQVKHTGAKRFGLEGGEVTIPALEAIITRGAEMGIEEVALGMAHRGRLNVLCNVMRKSYEAVFLEFQGTAASPDDVQGSGDVKYHLGTSTDYEFGGARVHLSLQANPSHLEAVDPVVLGKVRARQDYLGDVERRRVLALLIHGDAAMAGQGVVAECFGLSQLPGYHTGGTVHVVTNNQIGFTTSPHYARSSTYCTDVAKMVQAPILHVNGDDADATVRAARMAMEFRQTFKSDVVLDIVCYRRHGHNEADEPAFTQPCMYHLIGQHPTTRSLYAERLVKDGVLSQQQADAIYTTFQKRLEHAFAASDSFRPRAADWLERRWDGLTQLVTEEETHEYDTQVTKDAALTVGEALSREPQNFHLNKKIARQLKAKAAMFSSGQGIDWATGEALAFGTLLLDGYPVRLAGQDCGRGTFSQRHAVLVDQDDESRYQPLNHIADGQAHFEVIDSLLSEYGVLGYEYGYSLAEPNRLTLWEAQFGDFANGAQVIFDQFLAAAESKWLRMSGLVVLLPHGYEGQGPEHSSARLERYLQLCAEDNMQVCNLTTPANYFHSLRRQLRRNFRKPLIIMTPKSLLRHKAATSMLADFCEGSVFQRVIPETQTLAADDKVERVVFCSGKVYYDLLAAREERSLETVAIVRVEQLYPWPRDQVKSQIARYQNADVVWCQEEGANSGGWTFVNTRLDFILRDLEHGAGRTLYAGRKASASPATGGFKTHQDEQAALVEQAIFWQRDRLEQPFQRKTHRSDTLPADTRLSTPQGMR